jgi:hypothetical protein
MKTETPDATSTHKVRRPSFGCKRAQGHSLQAQGKRVRRPDPARIHLGSPDASLSAVGGLVPFAAFVRARGLDRELHRKFGHMKRGPLVVYPMLAQLRLLIDLALCGEERVFGLEALASDRIFSHLAGGAVPSVDTLYRDLERFEDDEEDLACLEQLMAQTGLDAIVPRTLQLHVDVDTTVMPLFGRQQGAHPGPNPHYHGRPSYHPLLAVVAETRTCIGAQLRPGDTGFGGEDVPTIVNWLERLRARLGPKTCVTVRMDAAADCADFLCALDQAGCRFIVKLRCTEDVVGALVQQERWHVVERDLDGEVTRQTAEVRFFRQQWHQHGQGFRVVAMRRNDRQSGNQLRLWDDDSSVQVYVTNDWLCPIEDLAEEYNDRAEVEPVIGELKHHLGLGKMPSQTFAANHAAMLIKLLPLNLIRAFATHRTPTIAHWRVAWLRRLLILCPARLLRSARRWILRLACRSPLYGSLAAQLE